MRVVRLTAEFRCGRVNHRERSDPPQLAHQLQRTLGRWLASLNDIVLRDEEAGACADAAGVYPRLVPSHQQRRYRTHGVSRYSLAQLECERWPKIGLPLHVRTAS